MKVNLEFDVPNEQDDLYYAQQGMSAFHALSRILELFRQRNKYCKFPEWQETTCDAIEAQIRQIIEDEEIRVL
jgi:hypothetical protein